MFVALAWAAALFAAPGAVRAESGVTLSATGGVPGDTVTLTVADPARIAELLPLAIHLRPELTFQDWPCDSAGSRYLGELEQARDGSATLTFDVPTLQKGMYRVVGTTADRSCTALGSGGEPTRFEVFPDTDFPALPSVELVTVGARFGPAVSGCGFFEIDGSEGVDDCGPYEYLPFETAATVLLPGGSVVFGISQNWRFGAWRLTTISESEMTPGLFPPEGQLEIARGSGGKRTIVVDLPRAAGPRRLFLTYRATRGPHAVNIDRPAVFRVDLRLPNTSTAPLRDRDGPTPAVTLPTIAVVALLAGVTGFAQTRPTRRRP